MEMGINHYVHLLKLIRHWFNEKYIIYLNRLTALMLALQLNWS